ncbi:MAG: hypothetical protein K9J37_15860 [Saprospiraceae bacterium]|nr:hypothetical protein [Saprospiraceae bacterium]MCF8251388.1 hypothetical protein [Saprospiraceae bacterium]MCF8283199.1 hypothetical protein [Bacteroidales bacterium]MCF8313219.1 hypothetical protein [Saprospiraceae bacterium]MCF8441666.1 hypothetical protein [Saprospiraceae bacterium]
MNKKSLLNLLLCATIITFSISCPAQTFIKAMAGVDFAKMQGKPNPQNDLYKIYDKGYSVESLSFGLGVEHKLSEAFSMLLLTYYTNKNISAEFCENCIAQERGFAFSYYRTTLAPILTVKENWYVGLGSSMNLINKVNVVYKSKTRGASSENKLEYGSIFLVGFKYSNFTAELSYHRGFKMDEKVDNPRFLFEPVNSFGLHFGYKFKIMNKRKGGRVDCPKL